MVVGVLRRGKVVVLFVGYSRSWVHICFLVPMYLFLYAKTSIFLCVISFSTTLVIYYYYYLVGHQKSKIVLNEQEFGFFIPSVNQSIFMMVGLYYYLPQMLVSAHPREALVVNHCQ